MWCSRCKKKFCQLCLKPVSFIPVHMHLFVCKASFKDKSFSYFMSIFFLTFCIFFYRKSFQSYWCIPILLLMHYCFHMFFDWIESLNSVMGMFMLVLLAGFITVIFPLLLGFRVTVQSQIQRVP